MKHWLKYLFLLLIISWVSPMAAQEIKIDNFCQIKKKFLSHKQFTTDKTQAILDLYTSEKGFTCKADGKTDINIKEEDDKITLLLPNKTRYIQINHPEYGELTWKVPQKFKVLKKKKHYRCDLITNSPKKKYQVNKQWAVFYVQPQNAILYVDSTMHFVRNGQIQVYLPLGNHACKVEAPFYESWEGNICLNDSERVDQQVNLKPVYSYLTVRTPLPNCTILLNGSSIGETQTISNRLTAGRYKLTIVKKSICYYNDWIDIKPAEKKVVNITKKDLNPMSIPPYLTTTQLAELPPGKQHFINDSVQAPVHIIAPDNETSILINREKQGMGEWNGVLPKGFYAINTEKDNLESATYYLWVENGWEQTINLATPQSAYGMLNIQSNVVDAEIFINGIASGKTPSIIHNLPANHTYQIKLKKNGYKDAFRTIYIRGNEMNDLIINMK